MPRTRQAPPAKSAATKRRPATTPSRGAAPAGGKKVLGLQRWQLILAAVVVGAVLVYLYVKNKNAASTTAATQTPDSATGQGYWDSSGAASGSPTTTGQTDANANPTDSTAGLPHDYGNGRTEPDPGIPGTTTYPLIPAGRDGSGVTVSDPGQAAVGGTPGGQGSTLSTPSSALADYSSPAYTSPGVPSSNQAGIIKGPGLRAPV